MRVDVRLSAGYFVAMAFLSVMWGLGLVLHFLVNNRVFPRFLDADGVSRHHLDIGGRSWSA